MNRWWYLKLKALIEIRDFERLETFSRSKKSPIGYEPFVNLLIASGSSKIATSYVQRCEQKIRAELYVKCSDWLEAGRECVRKSDRVKLMYVSSLFRCNSNQTDALITENLKIELLIVSY